MNRNSLRALVAISALSQAAAFAAPAKPSGEKVTPSSSAALVQAACKQLSHSNAVKDHPEIHVACEAGNAEITLAFHTREWLVYGASMTGDWSDQPHKEIGPKADGFLITVSLAPEDGPVEQWAGRDSGLDLAAAIENKDTGPSSILRKPYWRTYGGTIPLPAQKMIARVDIDFNNRPNLPLLNEVCAELKAALARAAASPKPK